MIRTPWAASDLFVFSWFQFGRPSGNSSTSSVYSWFCTSRPCVDAVDREIHHPVVVHAPLLRLVAVLLASCLNAGPFETGRPTRSAPWRCSRAARRLLSNSTAPDRPRRSPRSQGEYPRNPSAALSLCHRGLQAGTAFSNAPTPPSDAVTAAAAVTPPPSTLRRDTRACKTCSKVWLFETLLTTRRRSWTWRLLFP